MKTLLSPSQTISDFQVSGRNLQVSATPTKERCQMKTLSLSHSQTANSRTESVEKIISTHPFLEGMSPHQLRLLSDCAMPVHFNANELIFREGDPANRFYLIQTGRVALESQVHGKSRALIQTLNA